MISIINLTLYFSAVQPLIFSDHNLQLKRHLRVVERG